jgi:uncharacterized protein with FMN-binding domain
MVSMTTLYDVQNELTATTAPSEVTPPQSSTPVTPVDPMLDPRLQRLAARSAAARSQRQGTEPFAQASGQRAAASTTRRTRRQHAAKGSRAAALAMSAVGTLGLAAYFQHTAVAASNATAVTATTAGSAASLSTSASTTASVAAAATVSSSGLVDGTFTGETFTNKWGPVQAAITVSGGKVVNVNVLQTPTADNKSISINNRAVPTLVTEALTAQSSQVDTVSGATYTSDSYRSSLQSALDASRVAATNAAQS